MLDCIIAGDSIAVGTANFKMECESYSVGGINSHDWNKRFINKSLISEAVIISLGSNDLKHLNTEKELVNLRKRVVAKRVYWVLPANKPHKREVVKRIAQTHGDIVLPIKHVSNDRVHPTPQGYKDLANSIK